MRSIVSERMRRSCIGWQLSRVRLLRGPIRISLLTQPISRGLFVKRLSICVVPSDSDDQPDRRALCSYEGVQAGRSGDDQESRFRAAGYDRGEDLSRVDGDRLAREHQDFEQRRRKAWNLIHLSSLSVGLCTTV